MKELLNTTISRRDAVTTTAKLGAAVALSNAITLPFPQPSGPKHRIPVKPTKMLKPSGIVLAR